MSNRKATVLMVGLLMLLGAGFGFWFVDNYERVEETVASGEDPFLMNPYRLLTEYLEAQEVEVHRVESFDFLPTDLGEGSVVFLNAGVLTGARLEGERLRMLVEESGAHLVLGIDEEAVERVRELFRVLGIVAGVGCKVEEGESGDRAEEEHFSDLEEYVRGEDAHYYDVGVRNFCTRYVVEGADYGAVGLEEEEGGVVSGPRGAGRVTVYEGTRWLRGRGLEEGELIYVLSDVLALEGWPKEAYLYMSTRSFPWVERVGRRAWPLLVGLGLLFLLGLSRARRFGPRKPDRKVWRRRRGEHVEATGRFLWGHGGGDVLLKSTRRALIETVSRRRPSIRTMSPPDQSRLMADELGISREEMWYLLSGAEAPGRPEDFKKLIMRLEEVRRRV